MQIERLVQGGQGVVEEHALPGRDPQGLGRLPEHSRGLLVRPQLLGVDNPLKVGEEAVVGEGGLTVLGYAGGKHRHPAARRPAAVQILPDIGLEGDLLIGPLGQIHPLRDDLLAGLGELEKLLSSSTTPWPPARPPRPPA